MPSFQPLHPAICDRTTGGFELAPTVYGKKATMSSSKAHRSRTGPFRSLTAMCVPSAAVLLALAAAPAARAGGEFGPPIIVSMHSVVVYVDHEVVVEQFQFDKPPHFVDEAEPLSGAKVTVPGHAPVGPDAGTTNRFTLSVPRYSNTTISVSCSSYNTQSVVLGLLTTTDTVTLNQNATVIAPTTYAGISGTVNDTADAVAPAASVPVTGATVTCTVNGASAGTAVTTGSNGAFTIPISGGVATGASVSLAISAYGYVTGTESFTVSGTPATSATDFLASTLTLKPNGRAVYWDGSMSYVYGCDYVNWEYDQDFAPNGSAYWNDSQPTWTYDTTNTDPSNDNKPTSIEDGFNYMGTKMGQVNGTTPMRVINWMLFTDMSRELEWSSGTTTANATVTGISPQTYSEIDMGLSYAAQNNMRIMFSLITFYGFEPTANYGGNHRAVATTSEVIPAATGSPSISVGSTVQNSYVNNALIPVLQHIANWEQTNANVAGMPSAKNIIFAYDICNEPDQWMVGTSPNGTVYAGTYLGPTGNGPSDTLAPADVVAFTTRCAQAIHKYGGSALATLGVSNPYVVAEFQGCGLDFYSVHYNPFWNDATSYNNDGLPTAWSLGTGLPACNTLGKGNVPLDKPCVVQQAQTANQPDDKNAMGVSFTGEWCLNQVQALGYAGEMGWSYCSGYSNDLDYPDGSAGYNYNPIGNWAQFQPAFEAWPAANTWNPSAGTGVVIGPN
jgi:hypothetical protein